MPTLAGERERVVAYLQSKIRDMPSLATKEYEAIGVVKNGKLIGGVVYTGYSELPDGTHDIMMSAAGEVGWLTKASLREFFRYPLVQLNCSRITTIAAKSNLAARNLNERLGFVHEGTLRGAFGHGRVGILYGMLREDCKFIR